MSAVGGAEPAVICRRLRREWPSLGSPPGLQGNCMGWAYPEVCGLATAAVPSMVAVVIIPVGFPVPSAWSRTR